MEHKVIENCNHDEIDYVIREHWQDVWNYSFIITKDTHLSDDITQEVFIKVFKKWNSFRNESSVKTWLLKITRNTALNYLKSSYFKRISLVSFFRNDKEYPSAEKQFLEKETMNEVWDSVLKLPQKHREVLILDAKYELSYDEIAETLGVSIGTVKSRLHRARARVSKILAEDEL
ncbi:MULTISPECIES: RNA polymerase sigma factor [Bacillus cereus group]|uniref:RNA polymerase sigma factor n=1 Tax=Bacillus cereus TaxID=1396 RepID=A0AA44Q8V2_BACCE|nr:MULTISPECIES: sigma-70 family RNA polymerase sigma factor [Bacillus cereus group]EEL50291.1 RNA polymerase sigma-70 factor [Bacillus cereus Rock3-44]PFA17709.1 sigma-70 family RNA polymerase sigma factor [Bacillus cereus]PFN01961.1 sigma-70 family RNA polymerase sigma factor [Bacillus cereus]PFO78064.1 sigma-70 family RNA polymerase sigma factor [Bacillus cereus]PFR20778.1 sigma-70 family RNA polymerase sigma factor [Bacillus cereus]